MRRYLVLVVLVASLVAGACGGSSSASAYCQTLKDVQKEAADKAKASATTTSADYKQLGATADKALDKIVAKAPSELKDDYAIVRQYFDLYIKALSNPQADRKALTDLQTKFTAASKNISEYNKKQCKLDTTSTAPATATTAKS